MIGKRVKEKIKKLSILDKRAFETGHLVSILLIISLITVSVLIAGSLVSMNPVNLALLTILSLASIIAIHNLTQNDRLALTGGVASGIIFGYILGIVPSQLIWLGIILVIIIIIRRGPP
jgi:hypothetical protein